MSSADTKTGYNEEYIVIFTPEVLSPDLFSHPWARYPGNTTDQLCEEVLSKLAKLYELGKVDKKRKISADRAMKILIDDYIYDDWEQRVIISVLRIKAFFALSPASRKMDQYQQSVQHMEEDEMDKECIDNVSTLQDIDTL